MLEDKSKLTEAAIAAGITAAEIQQWGELSSEKTVQKLKTLAKWFLEQFVEISTGSEITEQVVRDLAAMVEEHIPHFFQGVGIATLPRQIEHFLEIKLQLLQQDTPDLRKELMRGLDCKLPTTMLAFILQGLATALDQSIEVFLVTTSTGSHPSLIAKINEPNSNNQCVLKIDSLTTIIEKPDPTTAPILDPSRFREHTANYIKVEKLDQQRQENIMGPSSPFITHELNAKGLSTIDTYFIQS